MRIKVALFVLMLWGCTDPSASVVPVPPVLPQNTGESALAFQLARGTSEDGPLLNVTVQNRSPNALCVRTEALRNPLTQEMMLYLRDARGRELLWLDSGFIPPPMEGVMRLEPGSRAEAGYYLSGRFLRRESFDEIPQGWSARAAVRYGTCENPTMHWAASAWQPL